MAQKLIDVKVDDRQVKQLARKLGVAKNKIPNVLVKALRATATSTRTIIKNEVRRKVPELPSSRVHKKTYIKPKATKGHLSTLVNIALSTIPLGKIKGVRGKGKRTKRGKSNYITWKGNTLLSAFRATMPSGHKGIFMRKYTGGNKPIFTYTGKILGSGKLGPSLPIQELGISVGDVYHNAPGVKERIDKQATEKLRINIMRQFNRLLK